MNAEAYHKFFTMVMKYILKNSGTISDAEDIMQEGLAIYLKVVKNKNFKQEGSRESYLFKICRNLWWKELNRRKKEKKNLQGYDIIEMTNDNNLKDLERKELLMKIIDRNVQKLSPKCKEVLSYVRNGLSHKEISMRIGYKNHMIVKDKIYRCKKILLELIQNDPEYNEIFEISYILWLISQLSSENIFTLHSPR